MRAAAILFLTDGLLWCLAGEVNHAISGLHVYLYLGGLLVVTGALALPFGLGLLVSLAAGALCDTAAPPALFGAQTLLFAAATTLLAMLRERLPPEDRAGRIVAALLANLALFVALSALVARRFPSPGGDWLRLAFDLAASQAALAAIAPWFFALQSRSLQLARAQPERTY